MYSISTFITLKHPSIDRTKSDITMTRRRSKLEIYLDVLWVIKNGTNKPKGIIDRVNLSWDLLQKILPSMLSQGLIMEIESREEEGTTKNYTLTQKSENILKYFSRTKELLPSSIDRFLIQGDYSSLSSFDISLDLSYLILLCQKP